MTATQPEAAAPAQPERLGLFAQLLRFTLIGGFSALVDFGVYHLLLQAGLWVHAAKGTSFIIGTTTAYLLNRRFTFGHSDGGKSRFLGFVLLYGTTFFINVGVNATALIWLPEMMLRTTVAWVIAQAVATVVNFVMLRTVVFRA